MRIQLTLIVAVLAAGCSKSEPAQPSAGPVAKTEPAKPAEPAQPEAARPTQQAVDLAVTADSVAGIRADTNAYEDLAGLFPGYEIEKSSFSAEGDDYDIFLVKKDGAVVLEVEPGPERAGISSVAIKSTELATPAGAHVGDAIDKVAKAGQSCFVGAEDSKNVFCPGESGFVYAVAAEGLGSVGPETEIGVAKLAGKKITAIRWMPE